MIRKMIGISCLLLILAVPSFGIGQNGEVIIEQQMVLRIRYPAGGMSIQERVDQVTLRLNEYLGSAPFDPSQVRVAMQAGEYCVMIDNQLIITADKDTAKFNQATPQQLAEMWAENLRKAIPKAKNGKGG